METKRNGVAYKGILEITINSFNVLKMSDDTQRVIAIVQNEDCLEYWLIDPLDPVSAIKELVRYYMEEEPWACFDKMMIFSARRYSNYEHVLGGHIAKLLDEGKLVPNEKTGGVTVVVQNQS